MNIPNLLTLLRILLIPVVLSLFFIEPSSFYAWFCVCCFWVACLTDYLDGFLARFLKKTTRFGQFLDPVADKLLVCSTLLFLSGFQCIQGVSLVPACIILCREILVSGLREFLSDLQVYVRVSQLAQWKTVIQMMAIGFLLLSRVTLFQSFFSSAGLFLLWGAALLTLITGIHYIKITCQHFNDSV